MQAMLQKYSENPGQNWRSKDAALYLVTSLAAKGQTEKHGVTQSSQLVNLTDFCSQHIIPELEKPDGVCFLLSLYILTLFFFSHFWLLTFLYNLVHLSL